jgi:kumamolisin
MVGAEPVHSWLFRVLRTFFHQEKNFMMRRLYLLLLLAGFASLFYTTASAQNLLTRHQPLAISNGSATVKGNLDAQTTLQLDVVLSLSDSAGLDAYLEELYNPASSSYRQFLTPAQFTERFGPSQSNYDAVVNYLQSKGLSIVGGSRDGLDVQVKGSVAVVEKAFNVKLKNYQLKEDGRNFFAPDREPTTGLGVALWRVSGLENYSKPKPRFHSRSDAAKALGVDADTLVAHATTGSGPSSSFLGSDMRAAYYGASTLTGSGQNLGLLEFEGTDLADLTTYYTNIGQTLYVTPTLLSVDGTSTSCLYTTAGGNCDDTEQTLDMTQALGVAPKLNSLVVYVGSTDTAILSAMSTHSPLPTTIGCSWGWTPVDESSLDPYFKKFAAQGQSFFAASGDSATWSSSNEAWPADDPYVTAVGGTDLVTTSAGGAWKSETAWSESGGGVTPDSIGIPSWQALSGVITSTNKGSSVYRNGPDVSANANYTYYVCADQTTCTANEYGGTSFAAPFWAGYVALINQQLATDSQSSIGFLNPLIYPENLTATTYATDFHDITSGTAGSYSAVTGYDLVTGWGSPNGTGLLNTLVTAGSTSTYTLSATPAYLAIKQGASSTTTLLSQVYGGFDHAVALTAASSSSSITATLGSSSITAPGSGTVTLTIAVGSSVTAGTYTVTVTGTGNSISKTATIKVVVSSSSSKSASSATGQGSRTL